MTENEENDSLEPEGKSKSQVKREMLALQELGKELVDLNDRQLAQVPLTPALETAIHEARRLPHREARRRQLRYIGKLMRSDHEAIEAALSKLQQTNDQHVHLQHRAESWRDRLLSDDDKALAEFIREHPQADIQHLRQILRMAQKEKTQNKAPTQARKLFRYIRELLAAGGPN